MDAQDEPYDLVLSYMTGLISKAVKVNEGIHIHVFINKGEKGGRRGEGRRSDERGVASQKLRFLL